MGRSKHMSHLEPLIQVNVKLTPDKLNFLEKNSIIRTDYSANKYINKLINRDLRRRKLLIKLTEYSLDKRERIRR